MKAYTDIEQSKKLAEILPLESADMYYNPYLNDEDWYDIPNFGEADLNFNELPCWSLAVLLDALPYPSLHKTFSGWRCDSHNEEGTSCIFGEPSDNQIDACYEMILKLHELNLL